MLGFFRHPKEQGAANGNLSVKVLVAVGSLLIGMGALAFAYLALTRILDVSFVHLNFWWGDLWHP